MILKSGYLATSRTPVEAGVGARTPVLRHLRAGTLADNLTRRSILYKLQHQKKRNSAPTIHTQKHTHMQHQKYNHFDNNVINNRKIIKPIQYNTTLHPRRLHNTGLA